MDMGNRNGNKNKGTDEIEISRNEKRARRKRARRRAVLLQRIFAVLLVLVAAGGCFAFIWNLPALRLDRELKAGEEYTQEEAFDEAIAYYEEALKIDSTSVKAYRYMANAYFGKEDNLQAKKVLLEGWQNTQDEGLLKYYCTTILNEAVAQINDGACTLETVQNILSVIEKDENNADALELMNIAYERVVQGFQKENDADFFYDVNGQEGCLFPLYQQIMDKLFEIYGTNSSEDVKNIILKYALIDVPELKISREHAKVYRGLLEKASALGENEAVSRLLSCLNKEEEIQNIFADMFTAFDAGKYEAAKDFVVSEAYTQIRDAFIGGTMEYWSGETYIPVSRETVILKQTDGTWTFQYPKFEDDETTEGIITVWGNKMTDEGIQRSCIAYEPAKEGENYFPHIQYVISYMYSNVQKENSFEAEMNYHFETRTWTEEGMTTDMIGGWGGPYQWEKTY
jgi:tetratricopeptide (TPR) repeat protein